MSIFFMWLLGLYFSCFSFINYCNMSNTLNIVLTIIMGFFLLVILYNTKKKFLSTISFVLVNVLTTFFLNTLNVTSKTLQMVIFCGIVFVLFIVLIDTDENVNKNSNQDVNKNSNQDVNKNSNQDIKNVNIDKLQVEINKINNYLSISKQKELETSKNRLFEIIDTLSKDHLVINKNDISAIINSINYENFNDKILQINNILKEAMPDIVFKKIKSSINIEFEKDIFELISEREKLADEINQISKYTIKELSVNYYKCKQEVSLNNAIISTPLPVSYYLDNNENCKDELLQNTNNQEHDYDIKKIINYNYRLLTMLNLNTPIKELNSNMKKINKNVLKLLCSEIFNKNQSFELQVQTLYNYMDSIFSQTNVTDILKIHGYVFRDYSYSRNLLILLSINDNNNYTNEELENLNSFLDYCKNSNNLLREYAKYVKI